ncbi:MAG: hypothetical protein KU38_05135 [Sulfurovum sp. FS08-3]|nr:MAG: hypothetical protein KU38_05135 [Sulfurovum sp. FS08-3]
MSSDTKRLEFIIEKIEDALSYKAKFGTIEKLLNSKMGFDAVTMCIMQVGETLNKLSYETRQKYPYLPIKESYLTRNYIAHDYEGVSKYIIEVILREHFPKLQEDIQNIINELSYDNKS